MWKTNSIKSLFPMLALLMLTLLVLQGMAPVSGLHLGTFDSPIATLVTPVPTLTPPVSKETQQALEYIAEREDIPVEQLVVANQHRREYELLGRTFWAVTLLDTKGDRWYNVLVDLADGSFVEDIEAVEQAEQEAYRARYGKLEPALFEHLEAMKPDDEVPVAIWVAGKPKRSEEELYAALAARYPEAQAALERSGSPFDVGDRELIHEIEAEYVRMLEADTQERIHSLVRYLEGQGYAATTFGGLPAVAVTLLKAAILELDERNDVGVVYLSGKKEQPALDSAVPSNRAPTVWQRGFKGNGVDIGILEEGRVDFDSPQGHNYLNQGAVRPCGEGVSAHKTRVASCAASFHPTYTGMAPESTIVDACTDGTDTDTVAGLEWATAWADPINYSAVFNNNPDLEWTDRAFDHWARHGNDTIVAGAGNVHDGYVGSPAKGWNVLAVGGSNDNNTSSWTDDGMWNDSSWKNPTSDQGDREKPEVVAPGESITVVGPDRGIFIVSGTSEATPQVAGLAALLIDRNIDLDGFPTAVRAIIVASAVNNVDGPGGIPTGQDLKDGAGAIDAALADTTAKTRWTSATTPCGGPCWWGFYIDNTNFPVGTYLYRYFNASRGERVRVAISWWSHADCRDKDHCYYDRLDTDLHLTVYDEDGQLVEGAHSASWDNNYELVEFIAPKTGQYKITVYKERADETSNHLGIAWVKDATYLPDLRNKDGWVSEFYVRNDGAEPRNVTVHYSDANGNPTPKGSDTCYLSPNQWCWIPVNQYNRISAGTTGSAIVGGGEDVSVVVKNRRDPWRYRYAYTGQAAPATTLYLPQTIHNLGQSYEWHTNIWGLNAGPASTNITTTFFNEYGSTQGTRVLEDVVPNGSGKVNQSGLGYNYWGAGRMSADQPVASVVQVSDSSTYRRLGYSGLVAGDTTVWLPFVMTRLDNDWGAVIWVHNTTDTGVWVDLDLYGDTNGDCRKWLYGKGMALFNLRTDYEECDLPEGWYGSARVSANQPVAVVVNQLKDEFPKQGASYEGIPTWAASRTVILPYVVRGDSNRYYSNFTVRNTSSGTAHITVYFYNRDGSTAASFSDTVSSHELYNLHAAPQPPQSYPSHGFVGSVMITADRPIAVSSNLLDYGNYYDTVSYTGVNR